MYNTIILLRYIKERNYVLKKIKLKDKSAIELLFTSVVSLL